MNKTLVYGTILSCTLLLSACASHTKTTPQHPSSKNDPSQVTLAEAASSISNSLVSLAATEQAAYHPVSSHPSPDPESYGMGGKASLDWSGPVEPLVEQIADSVSYKVKVVGHAPAIPVIVTVNTKNEPIGDILSNVAYQCGQRADVVVYPETRVVELRYAGN